MLGKKTYLLVTVFLLTFSATAQTVNSASIAGKIIDNYGSPISGASIALNDSIAVKTYENGNFKVYSIDSGKYILRVTMIGFKTLYRTINLLPGQELILNLQFQQELKELNEVSVLGRSQTQDVNRQSYNVTAIDATKLHNTTLDLSHALDRVSGVRVRESGGVGSNFNFSLNGFTGRQVKFFIDGVPMDNFGSSFQINNVPINLAERVEVYKGVVPVWLGSDALGGAVNIVTDQRKQNFLDVSYSYGSFNTHRSSLSYAYTSPKGFAIRVNAFQNYSDNSYKVTVTETDFNTQQTFQNIEVNRFHDKYHNETIIANVGVVDKSYADQLLFGVTLGKNFSEIQTGARMESVFGAWHRRGNIVMPSVKFQKRNLFIEGLDLNLTGNINLGEEQNIDTAYRRYNWLGQVKSYPGEGSERQRSMYKFQNNNAIATANLVYSLNEHHSFNVSNVLNSFNRKGFDPLFPNDANYDQPRKNVKNVVGLGYRFTPDEKWSTSIFSKYFHQLSKYSQSYNPSGSWGDVAYNQLSANSNKFGYGIASTYFLFSNMQLKASYEKSYRLPEPEELFGDVLNLEGNINLRPESSDNINLGLNLQAQLNNDHRFAIDANLLYRNAKDFIRPQLNPNETKQLMANLGGATNLGVDGEVRYSFKKIFTAGVNMTYQNLRNNTKYQSGYEVESPLYRDRIPNMPYLFGNGDASLFFNDFLTKGNTLSVGYNILYVHAYYLSWPSQGTASTKRDIPRQWNQDINITYTLLNGKYNIGLECKNIVDNRLYDNFSLQKPGRAFYAKVRYFINRY